MKYSISRHTQFQFPKIRHRGFISMETVSFDDSSLSHAICFSVRFPRASVNVIRPLLSNRSSPSSPHAYTVIHRLIRQYQSLNLIEETYFQCCTMNFLMPISLISPLSHIFPSMFPNMKLNICKQFPRNWLKKHNGWASNSWTACKSSASQFRTRAHINYIGFVPSCPPSRSKATH